MSAYDQLGDSVGDTQQLEEMLSRPTDEVTATMKRMEGDLLILGIGGKMGPTIAQMALRASQAAGVQRRIIGVSRFSSGNLEGELQQLGIQTVRCDLLDLDQVMALPDAPNILYMPAQKFGSEQNPSMTWAINTGVPVMVAQRYRGCRIVAFSSGNVYALVPAESGGSRETDIPCPVGDYATTVLGRERIFEYYSRALNTPTALMRLYYAQETRYGVLVDMARRVWNEQPIDVSMGYVNVIWQGDANAMILRAFDHVAVPAAPFNVVGPDRVCVRDACSQFGRIMGKSVTFTGQEAPDALLGNGHHGYQYLGRPQVSVEQMIRWVADWVMRGGQDLGKPTHFQTRNGKY